MEAARHTMTKAQDPVSLLSLPTTWDGYKDMLDVGFLQTTGGSLPKGPFVVRVSLPLTFAAGAPFYLHVTNKDDTFTLLISNDGIVNQLLTYMKEDREVFYWAEVLEGGQINFDTLTECPGW
jgi:hypothetical protein